MTRRLVPGHLSLFALVAGGVSATVSCTTPQVTAASAPHAVTLPLLPSAPAGMVSIPGGRFSMGSRDGDDDERPVHPVDVAPFYLDRTEVTVRAFDACIAAGACSATEPHPSCNEGVAGREDHPINCVTWRESARYCAWRGQRLPTEAEWEYAARGTDDRTYPWGNAPPREQLCWDGKGSDLGAGKRRSTCPVGSHPAGRSPFGVDDMAGNVWEWTAGFYSPDYAGSREETPPLRVTRGGTWFGFNAYDVRATLRFRTRPEANGYGIGVRCARDFSRNPDSAQSP